MYVIKMEQDKSLVCTIHATIYQGEKHADTLVFIVPKTYDTVNIADCAMMMRYILPNGVGRSEQLSLYPLPYNDNYFQYKLSVKSRFTAIPGDITVWLTAINNNEEEVLKSGETKITVTAAKNIDHYMDDDSISQLDILAEQIVKLQKEKADGLLYDEDTRELQLTADGDPIDEAVIVPGDNFSGGDTNWEDIEIEESGGNDPTVDDMEPDDPDEPTDPDDDNTGSGDGDIYWEPI